MVILKFVCKKLLKIASNLNYVYTTLFDLCLFFRTLRIKEEIELEDLLIVLVCSKPQPMRMNLKIEIAVFYKFIVLTSFQSKVKCPSEQYSRISGYF